MIFLAGNRFHATGNIDAKRPHRKNGLDNIFGSQATSKNDAMRSGKYARLGPVGSDASTAKLAGDSGVKKESTSGSMARKTIDALPFSCAVL